MSAELARSLGAMGIRSERVLAAVTRLDRSRFIPPERRADADADGDYPLPIGFGQTISQPFIAAFMTEALRLGGDERVLEVGTGSGYQTALLALLARNVHSVEIIPELAARARTVLLDDLRLENVSLRVGDGALGWPAEAPFDRIMVTAACPDVPATLLEQLARGGRMVLPVDSGPWGQVLRLVDRRQDGSVVEEDAMPVRFVPLTHGLVGHDGPRLG